MAKHADLEAKIHRKVTSGVLQQCIDDFGFSNKLRVNKNIKRVNKYDYDGFLKLGFFDLYDDSIALFVSSQDVTFDGRPIKVFLVPRTIEGSFLIDKNNGLLATRYFYDIQGNSINLINTEEPLILDGLDISYGGLFGEYNYPKEALTTTKSLARLTNDKILFKKLLIDKGIKTPEYHVVRPREYKGVRREILDFTRKFDVDEGFVVKGNNGSCGDYVRMYDQDQIESSARFAESLIERNKSVILERRVIPLELKSGRSNEDWNVRVLVTVSANPQYIDAEVRHRPISKDTKNKPVNIAKGAKASEISYIAEKKGVSVDEIIETSIRTARAIYSSGNNQNNFGFVGLDLIVTAEGSYVLEANSGPGGFSTLSKIRGLPSDSFKRLFTSFGNILLSNHERAAKVRKRFRVSDMMRGSTGEVLYRLGDLEDAVIEYRRDKRTINNEEAQHQLGDSLERLGRHDEAVEVYKRIIKINPSSSTAYFNLCYTLVILNRYEEALIALDKVLEIDEENAKAHANRGYVLWNLGKEREAYIEHKNAVDLKGVKNKWAYKRANALASKGNYKEAIRLLGLFV
ncbi:tetratricopeptide repeat protein [Candidatus Woesearchaeota archaeon]|nr:tetratricopeptide repeat protein [Candidatus Woesearchaeota archaeon]